MAMCVMAVVGAAPCQCFSPGGNQITSPGPNFFDRAAPALYASAASRYDQCLPQRMGVPCCPGARLERDDCAGNTRGIASLEWRVNAHRAGKPVGRSFAGWLGATSFDFHINFLCVNYLVRDPPRQHFGILAMNSLALAAICSGGPSR